MALTSLLMMPELEKEVQLESQGQPLDEGEDGKRMRFGLELGPAQTGAKLAFRSPGALSAWEKVEWRMEWPSVESPRAETEAQLRESTPQCLKPGIKFHPTPTTSCQEERTEQQYSWMHALGKVTYCFPTY